MVFSVARPSSTIVATRSIPEHWPFPQPLRHSPHSPSDFVSLLLSPSPISCSNGSAPSHSLPLSVLQNHLLTTLLSSFVGVFNKPPIRPMAKLRKRYSTTGKEVTVIPPPLDSCRCLHRPRAFLPPASPCTFPSHPLLPVQVTGSGTVVLTLPGSKTSMAPIGSHFGSDCVVI